MYLPCGTVMFWPSISATSLDPAGPSVKVWPSHTFARPELQLVALLRATLESASLSLLMLAFWYALSWLMPAQLTGNWTLGGLSTALSARSLMFSLLGSERYWRVRLGSTGIT